MRLRAGGSTPEELETLLEDASVMTDAGVLAQLFEDGAVVVGGNEMGEAPGREEIERYAESMCDHNPTYLADPRRVIQARDVALVVSDRSVSVMRRGSDGAWRYLITLTSWERMQPERRPS